MRELTLTLHRHSAEDAISASFALTLFQTILWSQWRHSL